MFFKLIFKNVKKNIHDYLIYFLTLMIAVSLFYSFNSIESQEAFTSLNLMKGLLAKQLSNYINWLSYVIAIVLAFLIIYANQFLLKRRKKELGIYMTLGMNKGTISRIFVGETFLIGIFALGTGLALGFILSQWLSLVAIKLFAVDLSAYRITFSITALNKTVICFGIIFFIVIIFNVRIVSKVKLIDMIMANRKNETLKLQSKGKAVILLFISIIILALTGYFIYRDGILPNSKSLKTSMIFFLIGTLLFFYSLSAVVLEGMKSNKNIYLKDLNAFLFRQLGSKIQTNFISMTVICALLTVTICIISSGFSVALTMNTNAKEATPYDMTVVAITKNTGNVNLYDTLLNKNVSLDRYLKNYVEISNYSSHWKYKDMFNGKHIKLWKIDSKLSQISVPIISVSDFNKVMKLQGKDTITLKKNEFLLNCNYEGTKKIMNEFMLEKGKVNLNGITLWAKRKEPLRETITMTSVGNNDRGTLIVNDSIIQNFKKDAIILSGIYKENTNPDSVIKSLNPLASDLKSGFKYTTKTMMYDVYYGSTAVIVFLCSYIGLIFLIISVSVLALQQLTETADNVQRYGLLRKLGVDENLINKTLFKQIFIYFIAPLTLASIFSIVGIQKVMDILLQFINMNISVNMRFTLIIFLIVYGGYFIATYYSCKKIIEDTLIGEE